MGTSPYTVERSAVIAAPPQRVYELVAAFPQWRLWSPWEDLDPDLQRSYSGADQGRGAVYAWSGNRKAGKGRMKITEAVEPSKIVIALDFERPFRSSNTTTFTFVPMGADTEVCWGMTGPRPLFMRLLGFAFDMEKLVGRDFERGLARLSVAATGSAPGRET